MTADLSGRMPHDRETRSGGAVAANGTRATSWSDRFQDWRNGLLRDPAFHRRARRNPLLRLIARRRARGLFDLASGFVYSQTLSACVQLRLFEHLADGPLSAAVLAERCSLERDAADTLLRAAASLRLVQRRRTPSRAVPAIDGDAGADPGDVYGLGVHGAALLANPGVMTMVEHHAFLYRDLSDPVGLLRRETPDTLLSMFWDYRGARRAGAQDGVDTGPYTELMSASQAMVAEQIIDCYPLRSHQCLLDIGGGDGTFLRTVAASAPDLSLRLMDLPPVAAAARARFAEAKLPNAIDCVGGDMFEDELPTGADVISLVRIVHDHDEEPVRRLLARCRAALPPGGTLLLAEPMAREHVGDPATDAYFGMYLHAMGQGRPRTATELRVLLENAGFARVNEVRTAMPMLTGLLVARV